MLPPVMRRWAFVAVLVCFLSACSAAMRPSADISEVAERVNSATRFGRLDLAAQHMSPDYRDSFSEQRAAWGTELRIVDSEVSRLSMVDEDQAEVLVDIAWTRFDETTVRRTRLLQVWKRPDSDWLLSEESRVGGALGLMGERVVVLTPGRPDQHLPSKTIR